MSSNIREFNLGLERFAGRIPEEVEKAHRALALEGLKGVVQMTPVDEGRARGNWQVTHDDPASGTVERLDKNGAATVAAGNTVIGTAKAYSVTWLTNNVPYINRLEDGYSRQAPQGMVRVTAQRLRNWLRRP